MKFKNEKTFSIIKVILAFVFLLAISGAGAITVATKVNNVTIKLANGYEMQVLTNKTKVEDILKENNILLADDEKTSPSTNQNITDEKTIVISSKTKQEIKVAEVSASEVDTTIEELLEGYDTITEKVVVEKEEIPFETVKKDVSDGASSTRNVVLQKGENGIKEITYKVKYQNDTEISKKKISEKVIKKPVDKIVQVSSAVISARSSEDTRTYVAKGETIMCKVTAYCACMQCCGKTNGITASGTKAKAGRTIAAPRTYSFGTKLLINGNVYTVEDRGGAIQGNRIDMFMDSHSEALRWGVKYLPVTVVE